MDDCCAQPTDGSKVDESACPVCGERGRPVKSLTIRSLMRENSPAYHKISDGFLCANLEDPIVHFFPEMAMAIDKAELTVRVGLKEMEEPITVCYCFQHTKSDIELDFAENGRSTIEEDIRQKVQTKQCSCEIMNPTGRCCLGDVRDTYLASKEEVLAE